MKIVITTAAIAALLVAPATTNAQTGEPLPPGMVVPEQCMYDCDVYHPPTPPTVPPTLPPGVEVPERCMYDCNVYNGPPVEPDPTNCYTGDYQGAPIEICMPTGWEPDPSWTIQGEPIVMYDSTAGVGVTDAGDTVAVAQPPAPTPEVSWLDELQAILVESGGW